MSARRIARKHIWTGGLILLALVAFAPQANAQGPQLQSKIDLGTLGGGNSSATAVGPNGNVTGWSNTSSGDQRAFWWTKSVDTSGGEPIRSGRRGLDHLRSDVQHGERRRRLPGGHVDRQDHPEWRRHDRILFHDLRGHVVHALEGAGQPSFFNN